MQTDVIVNVRNPHEDEGSDEDIIVPDTGGSDASNSPNTGYLTVDGSNNPNDSSALSSNILVLGIMSVVIIVAITALTLIARKHHIKFIFNRSKSVSRSLIALAILVSTLSFIGLKNLNHTYDSANAEEGTELAAQGDTLSINTTDAKLDVTLEDEPVYAYMKNTVTVSSPTEAGYTLTASIAGDTRDLVNTNNSTNSNNTSSNSNSNSDSNASSNSDSNASSNSTEAKISGLATLSSQSLTDNTWGIALQEPVTKDSTVFHGLPVSGEEPLTLNVKGAGTEANDPTDVYVGTYVVPGLPYGTYSGVTINYTAVANAPILYMQDVAEWKDNLEIGDEVTAIDRRDNKTYAVAKLKDGNIWMTQNLDLDLDSSVTYTNEDTDLGYNPLTGTYETASWTPVRSTYETAEDQTISMEENFTLPTWCEGGSKGKENDCENNYTPESYDPGDLYSNDYYALEMSYYLSCIEGSCNEEYLNQLPEELQKPLRYHGSCELGSCNQEYFEQLPDDWKTYYASCDEGTTNNCDFSLLPEVSEEELISPTTEGIPQHHLGNLYNWNAAVAMNDTSEYNVGEELIEQSICPTGWTLPRVGGDEDTYEALLKEYEKTYDLDGQPLERVDPYTATFSPLYLNTFGLVISAWENSLIISESTYWSALTHFEGASFTDIEYLPLIEARSRYEDRANGFSIRCIARPVASESDMISTVYTADKDTTMTIGEQISDQVTTFSDPTDLMEDSNVNVYLKQVLGIHNYIKASYVEFVITPEMASSNEGMVAGTYSLKGGDDGASYEENVNIIKTAFGYDTHPERCWTGSTYSNGQEYDGFGCNVGGVSASSYQNGDSYYVDNRNMITCEIKSKESKCSYITQQEI